MPVAEVEEIVQNAREAIQEHCLPMAECVGDALHTAGRQMKTAWKDLQRSAADLGDDTRHAIRRRPVQSVLIAGSAGIAIGAAIAWIVRRK